MNIATIPARQGLNFPTATAADWQRARGRLIRFLVRHDLDYGTAEEVTQQHLSELLTQEYSGSGACPASLAVAIGWAIARAKRYGIGTLTREGNRHSVRRRRNGLEETQPVADPVTIRDTAPGWTDPAIMAEEGEALAARMPRLAAKARQEGTTPAGLALRACGWGWPADDEGKTVPAVTDVGPGYTPPATGCPGLHTDTDPRPTWHRHTPQPLTGQALANYRQALAEHYAGRE